MRIAALILALIAGPLRAADPGSKDKSPFPGSVEDDSKDLVSPAPVDWTRLYSLAPYREVWTLTVDVKQYDKGLPDVLKIFDDANVKLTIPLTEFPHGAEAKSQQLSYKLTEKIGRGLLKKLQKIGAVTGPKITHAGEPVNLAEVSDKLAKLTADKSAHSTELAQMPSVSAMVDEMIQHLSAVKQVRESVDTEVLLNMTVREKH
jgi:hypothetical protein